MAGRMATPCNCGDHVFAPATKGAVALVSPNDADLLSSRCWMTHPKGYIHANGVKLHREIMQAPSGLIVDHINHDKSDCRRKNLRLATDAQSVRNRRKLRRNSNPASQYIGVHRNGNGWIARITAGGRRRSVGTFATEVEAARAYDRAAVEFVGEFANLNFRR